MTSRRRVVVPYATPGCVLWWTTPPWGQIAIADAIWSWSPIFRGSACTVTPTEVTEDASVGQHIAYAGLTPANGGPSIFCATIGPLERTWAHVILNGAATPGAYINLTTGTVGTTDPGVVVTSTANGPNWDWTIYHPNALISGSVYVIMATGDGVDSYAGDGSSRIYFDTVTPTISQPRVTGITDMVPVAAWPPGKTGLYNSAQPVVNLQPFYHLNAAVNRNEIWNPSDTSRYLQLINIELMAFLMNSWSAMVVFERLGTNTVLESLVETTGVGRYAGIDTTDNHFLQVNTRLTAGASSPLGIHVVFYIWDNMSNTATIYEDEAVIAGPTVLAGNAGIAIEFFSTFRQIARCDFALWNRVLTPTEIIFQSLGTRARLAL